MPCANATINVASTQGVITIFGADLKHGQRYQGGVLSHEALVVELERLRDAGLTKNADISRILKIPTSRVAEIFDRKRLVRVDEMKALVEHFGLDGQHSAPSVETLEPLLDAILPLAPPGRMTDQSRRALAEALSYGLALLGSAAASEANSHAITVAARAAATRYRETAIA